MARRSPDGPFLPALPACGYPRLSYFGPSQRETGRAGFEPTSEGMIHPMSTSETLWFWGLCLVAGALAAVAVRLL